MRKQAVMLASGALLIGIAVLVFVLARSRAGGGVTAVGTSVGDRAPAFTIETIDGQRISLADLLGKTALVITSTASWCPTCVIEARYLAPVYQTYRDRVEFLSVSIDPSDDRRKLESFRVGTDSPWRYTEPNRAGVRAMIVDYALTRFEITYVIDREGTIRFRDTGITSEETLRGALERALGS